jgi:hypothetical protein
LDLTNSDNSSNYNVSAISGSLQFTRVHNKFSQFVFTSGFLATAPTSADSSVSVFNCSCTRWLMASSQSQCQSHTSLRKGGLPPSFRLGAKPFENNDQMFFLLQLNPRNHSPSVTSSLTNRLRIFFSITRIANISC